MRLIINASNLSGTGVCQVAISFIEECRNHTENSYLVFLSDKIASNIDIRNYPNSFSFYVFKGKLYNPIYWFNIKKMKTLATKFQPDSVFSVFGPSWWNPRVPHLQGYAYPHYVYPDSPIWEIMSLKERIKWVIFKKIHRYALRKSGDYFVCETEDVRNRLSSYLNVPLNKIYTVNNTANTYFREHNKIPTFRKDPDEFRFFSMCSPYFHKNLRILNQVIPILEKHNINSIFYVTLRTEDYNKIFIPSVKHRIKNVGILKPNECPNLVLQCDALFLPTLLECFSASYPEAMIMQKPIITSNLSFAHDICGDAALYFDPLDPINIANTIIKLIMDKKLQNALVKEGQIKVESFNTPSERAKAYLSICKNISYRNDN